MQLPEGHAYEGAGLLCTREAILCHPSATPACPGWSKACSAHPDKELEETEKMASFLTGSSSTRPSALSWGRNTGRRPVGLAKKDQVIRKVWSILGFRRVQGPTWSFSQRPFLGNPAAWVTSRIHGWGRLTTKCPGTISVYPKVWKGSRMCPPAKFAKGSLLHLQLVGPAERSRALRRCGGHVSPCLKVGAQTSGASGKRTPLGSIHQGGD